MSRDNPSSPTYNDPPPAAEGSSAGDGDTPSRPLSGALQRQLNRLCSTRINGRLGLISDIAVGVFLLSMAFRLPEFRSLSALGVVGAGLFAFTFAEYCFHRWLFHGTTPLFEEGHGQHHEQPMGYDALPFFLMPLAILVAAQLLGLAIPREIALQFAGGFAIGYAAYGVSHTLIHQIRFRSALMRRWAASHHIHHRHPGSNFGVTTPLWDVVMGTRYQRLASKDSV
jgi:sterol desaturase/sphingolipid hydroxylase (fatty acid hydroxylase superfamily)